MSTLSRLRSLWRNLVRRDRVERDLDDELRACLDLDVAERVASGMRPEEARRAAAIALGRIDAVKDGVRDVRAGAALEGLARDARYGIRILRRNPVFTLAATLSLAIGIGATTTIFTVANGLLLRVAPGVTAPDRLVDVVARQRGHVGFIPATYETYQQFRERVTTVTDLYAYALEPQARSLRSDGAAARVFAGAVSANYFAVLGVPAAAGRVFDGSERADAMPSVVLSHEFWMRRFNGDPEVVGRILHVNARPCVIVGVAREGFRGLSIAAPDLWMPLGEEPAALMVGGRLRPGVSRAQADAEVRTIGAALAAERAAADLRLEWSVAASSPLPATLRGMAGTFVGLLLAIVSVVLAIACANVAGVLLARATARRREMAVRIAIGAGRARVVRQLITETLLLFVLGAAGGVALARALTTIVLTVLPAFPVPIALALPIDGRVLAFSTALSLVAAVLCGLAPALHASRTDVVSALKDEAQGPSDPLRLRQAFVVAQVALSLLLVVTSALLGRALGRVTFGDKGFDRNGVDVASVDVTMAGYTAAAGRQLVHDLRDGARRIPGVTAATVADRVPGGPLVMEASRRDRGAAGPIAPPSTAVSWTRVAPGYFATLRIPLVAGRDFTTDDRIGSQPVVIVDESTARRLWPAEDAVGRVLPSTIAVPGETGASPKVVVGVVRDVRPAGRQRDLAVLGVYAPLLQMYSPRLTVIARSERGGHAGDLDALITSLDADLPVLAAGALAASQDGPVVVQLRIAALVSGAVGVIGLLLASLGIYGVTAYMTAQRTRELGIRMTLGAQPAQVLWLVLRQGLKLVAIGAVAGLAFAAIANQVLSRMLFGLPALDLIAFTGAAVLFGAVGLAACSMPALRATRLAATEALRYE